MLIYINKIIAAFLLPPGIIILLMVLLNRRLYIKKQCHAKMLSLLIVGFYLMTIPYVSDGLMRTLECQYIPPQQVFGDVIIMLGGGATGDTPDIDGLGNLSGSTANRLITAVRMQKKINVPIIVSGGKVFEDTGTEAMVAQRILLDLGVPSDKIIVEDQSLNTQQNAEYVMRIIKEGQFKQPILVTSAFHMPRSVMNFQKLGITVEPYPTDYMVNVNSKLSVFNFVPNNDAYSNFYIALREYLGMVAVRLSNLSYLDFIEG